MADRKEPTEAEVIALFNGDWSSLDDDVLDGYRRKFEDRGWDDALAVVEDEINTRWIARRPGCVVLAD